MKPYRVWILIALVVLVPAVQASAAEPYQIGLSAAITGPAAATYAPTFDAYKAYFKRVNDAGGINGHPVEILVEDDRGEPSRAAANAKKFSEGVIAVVVASTSATYNPFLVESETGKIPLLFGGGVCPPRAFPPAAPLVFCSTSFGAQWDSRFAIGFIKQRAGGKKVKVGFVAQNIPISQSEMVFAKNLAGEQGLEALDVVVVPGGTADLTPFASRIKESGAEWVLSWAPWPIEIGVFEALNRIGWNGNYLLYAHQQAQADLTRLKAPNLLGFGGNSFFSENLPIHRQIIDAVKGVTTHSPDFMAEGWVSAMVIEAGLRKCGWPCGKEKLAQALTSVSVDTKGVRGGPIEWTTDNHYRKNTYYKVSNLFYFKGAIVSVADWTRLEVK